MRFTPDQLRDKALYALEEALQEIRYQKSEQTAALRFALAYLWSISDGERAPFDDFWKRLGERGAAALTMAGRALDGIYRGLGVERDEEVRNALWRKAHKKYYPDAP